MVIGIGTERAESLNDQLVQAAEEELARDPENFSNLVIAQVTNYVNVRDIPSEDGEIVGKLYDDSVGTYIEEVNGWYKITSGNVTGYVKAEFCVTGDEAIALAREVGSRMATVTTTTLKVRTEPSTESEVLGLVPIEEDLSVYGVSFGVQSTASFHNIDFLSFDIEITLFIEKYKQRPRTK